MAESSGRAVNNIAAEAQPGLLQHLQHQHSWGGHRGCHHTQRPSRRRGPALLLVLQQMLPTAAALGFGAEVSFTMPRVYTWDRMIRLAEEAVQVSIKGSETASFV